MFDVNVSTVFSFGVPSPAVYWIGLSDKDCDDPLNDGLYSSKPFEPRNTKPPHPTGESIPEVRKLENGDTMRIIEPWEWTWWWMWKQFYPSLPDTEAKRFYASMTRGNAAFTNKNGSDTKRSWVLGTNADKEPMRWEGVDCPGGNIYRQAGEPQMKNGRMCLPIWCLDYSHPPADPKAFAATLPAWLRHVGKIVHSDGRVTNFDHDFCIPLITSVGRRAVVSGYNCRENFIRLSRVRLS